MNCKNCGASLSLNDSFCKNCGAIVNVQEVQGGTKVQMQQQQKQVAQSGVIQQVQVVNNQMYQQPQQVSQMQQPQQVSGMQTKSVFNNQQVQQNNINNNLNYEKNSSNQVANNQSKKSSGGFKNLLLGFVLGAIVFGGLYFYSSMNKSDSGSSTGSDTGNAGSSGVVDIPASTKFYKIKFKNFIFILPDNLLYQEKDDVLLVSDEGGAWSAQLEINPGNFAQIKSNISSVQSSMQKNGFTVSAADVKILGGVEFITIEMSKSSQNLIASVAKLDDMNFIGVTVWNLDNEFDYKLLEKFAPIVDSFETVDVTNNVLSNAEIDMSELVGLAKSDNE